MVLVISVLCTCVASAQTKTVVQLFADAEHGDKAALEELITLADTGSADAQFHLALVYEDGKGMQKNIVQAVNWYRKAAEQGHPIAQFNLSVMYSNGDGVPKDHVEAANWRKKAAEQGLAIAEYALAWIYSNGDGVAKDNVKAFMWYDLAAAQGFVGAKTNRDMIGKMMTHAEIAEARRLSRERKSKK